MIGTAIALNLLFGIPLIVGRDHHRARRLPGALLMNRGFRTLEAFIIALLIVIFVCFAIQIAAASPPVAAVMDGLVPVARDRHQPGDALHRHRHHRRDGHAAQSLPALLDRADPRLSAHRRGQARRDQWATTDSTIALMLALFVNASILIVAAVAFHDTGHQDVAEIEQAYELLSPLLGLGIASTLFAVALLASGLNSTVTATLAGQIVMEGFLRLRMPHWARRLVTRGLAIVPVVS